MYIVKALSITLLSKKELRMGWSNAEAIFAVFFFQSGFENKWMNPVLSRTQQETKIINNAFPTFFFILLRA